MPAQTKYAWGSRPYLRFEYLSPVPFCSALLEPNLLAPDEVAWLDTFHRECAEQLSDDLLRAAARGAADEGADLAQAKAWLARATAPLAC